MSTTLYLSTARVQQWLEKTSLTVTDIDPMRETTCRDLVFGFTAGRYSSTTWLSEATTPSLVLNLMGALYASYYYNAVYSENQGETDYGRQLWAMVMRTLQGIQSGSIDLVDAIGDSSFADFSLAGFYPTDAQDTDGLGEERKFTMGATF